MQIDFVFQDTLRPNPTFVSYFGPVMTIDDPSIYLYETYTVVIRDLHSGTIVASYDKDANGHLLSVAPPNLGPVGTPNSSKTLASRPFHVAQWNAGLCRSARRCLLLR